MRTSQSDNIATIPGYVRAPGGLPPAILFGGYALLCLVPVLLAAAQGQPFRNLFRELSSGLVMVGYVMMLLQFVLSGRFEWLSGKVGIDRTMRFHQLVSFLMLAFVVLHPLLYAAPRLSPDPADALASLQRMFASPNLRSGVVAWWLMIALVVLAIIRDRLPVRYEIWRASHGVFAIVIALAGTHHTLKVGTYSADPWLAGFWIVATAFAVLSMVYVYAVKPLLLARHPYRVVSNRKVADRMWEVAVEPANGEAMHFAAGQFAWLKLGQPTFSLTEHPFSISSAPAERPRIAFTIKESGDFTRTIGTVAPGTTALLDGPHGNFTLAGRSARGVVLIAGGVGFAPIMGMLRQLRAERYPHPVKLIYGNRIETQILYREETEAMQAVLDLELHYVLSEPKGGWTGATGELTASVLDLCLGPVKTEDWLYFVCGPAAMMDSVEQSLEARRVPSSNIVSERFVYT
jgi:predicted ferric reductase